MMQPWSWSSVLGRETVNSLAEGGSAAVCSPTAGVGNRCGAQLQLITSSHRELQQVPNLGVGAVSPCGPEGEARTRGTVGRPQQVPFLIKKMSRETNWAALGIHSGAVACSLNHPAKNSLKIISPSPSRLAVASRAFSASVQGNETSLFHFLFSLVIQISTWGFFFLWLNSPFSSYSIRWPVTFKSMN